MVTQCSIMIASVAMHAGVCPFHVELMWAYVLCLIPLYNKQHDQTTQYHNTLQPYMPKYPHSETVLSFGVYCHAEYLHVHVHAILCNLSYVI